MDGFELLDQVADPEVVRIEDLTGLGHHERVVVATDRGQQLGVVEHRLRAVGAEGEGLLQGELGFLDHPLLHLRAGRGVDPGRVNRLADGVAQLGEGLLRVVVTDKGRVTLETGQVALQVGLDGPVADFTDRGFIIDPIADEALRILAPVFMVAADHFFGDLRHRVPLDLHDDAVGRQVRVHPVEREGFFDVELMRGVLVEDDLGEQPVDLHDRHLARNRNTPVGQLGHLFARLQVVGIPFGSIHGVFLEGPAGVFRSRRKNFAVGIKPAGAGSEESRIGALQQQPVQADAVGSRRVLHREGLHMGGEFDRGEPGGILG